MAKRAKEGNGGDIVNRAYGVVPRPRSSVCPEAWARTKRPGKWRAYYGYRYRPDIGADLADGGPRVFSDAAVAAAMVAHSEIGGRIVAAEPAPKPEIKVSYMHGRKPPTPRPHGVNGVDCHVGPTAPAAAPEPVCEPEPVPLPEPAPEAFVAPEPSPAPAEAFRPEPAPCACEPDRLAIAAAVLRDLAAKYGPRRAHKLLAMADFVTAAAGIAA